MVELLPFRGIFSHQEVELNHSPLNMGFPGGSDGEESVWRCGLNPWVRKMAVLLFSLGEVLWKL